MAKLACAAFLLALAFYRERMRVAESGVIATHARGVLFVDGADHVEAEIQSEYRFQKSLRLPPEQFRHVTELGELEGKTYRSHLVSVVFTEEEFAV